MALPKLELRKISYNARLSQETSAYAADLYVDGKLFARVSNHGHGGCDDTHPAKGVSHADLMALEARVKAEHPKLAYVAHGERHEFDATLETVCGDLLTNWLIERDVKRDLSRKVMFVKPKDGRLYGCKIVGEPAVCIAAVKKHHGLASTLNEMPLAQAVAIYRAQGARMSAATPRIGDRVWFISKFGDRVSGIYERDETIPGIKGPVPVAIVISDNAFGADSDLKGVNCCVPKEALHKDA